MSMFSTDIELIQNPALGAVLLWRFVTMYSEKHETADFPPLHLLFLVLPFVLYRPTHDMVLRTRLSSGLRALTRKMSTSEMRQEDILSSMNERVFDWKELTVESLKTAIARNLVQLRDDGTIVPLLCKPPSKRYSEPIKTQIRASERLGEWFSQLSFYEVCLLLRVRF